MAKTWCGFNSGPQGTGRELLVSLGPTLPVDIGFDSSWVAATATAPPRPGVTGVHALVDTGASECCIDSLLAAQLGLPIVDRRPVSGVHGRQLVNMHLAQVYAPALRFWIYGVFAGVDLAV